jgi:hypothetical protein
MGYTHTPTTSPMGIDLGLEYLEYLPFATYFVSCLIIVNASLTFRLSNFKDKMEAPHVPRVRGETLLGRC